MFRVTSLTEMPEAQLNRWIKRIGLLLFVGIVAFVAFYAVDRFRAPAASIADRQLTMLEEAVRQDPSDVAVRGQLADTYVARERYDEAIALYTQIIETGKEQRPAYIGRGRALEFKGDLAGAAADYTKVVEMSTTGEMAAVDATLARAYFGLGAIALKQDKADESIEYLTKALAIKRTDADTMNLLGAAYVKAGQPDEAIKHLEQAILFVPIGWAEPYQTLSDAYAAKGEADKAEWAAAMAQAQTGDGIGATARLEAIKDGKAGLDARVSLGLIAEQTGDTAAAATWYRSALELESGNTAAAMGLARVTTGTQSHPSIAPSPSA
ncbi:MAG TPA: tetratricopeptide repeat protein, partial [Candidatus Limnocylindrales bacterium]|nr:tetratricopeptide repeat protein [Candidatus Limnocylindrales bacterium]